MRRLSLVVLLGALSTGAAAAPHGLSSTRHPTSRIGPAAANQANQNSASLIIKAEVLLDRAHFSPGEIDGRDGDNFHHGTPQPGKISKTESHGCIRLTNWDALDLAARVRRGAVVKFEDQNSPVVAPNEQGLRRAVTPFALPAKRATGADQQQPT